MNNYLAPIPTGASKRAVHDFAENAARKLGYTPGSPIEDVVSKLGGKVCYNDVFDDDEPDSIRAESVGEFYIYLSSFTSPQRDRFTIAHELGHYLLHFPAIRKQHPEGKMIATRWVDESDQNLVRTEWEANWFAAAFLMPEAEFLSRLSKHDISDVADTFGVSVAAAKVREKNLKG
jgi:predicted transcriptional regulator